VHEQFPHACYSHGIINLQVHSICALSAKLEKFTWKQRKQRHALDLHLLLFICFFFPGSSFFSVSVSICRLSRFLLPYSLVQLEAKLVLGDEDDGWQCFFMCFFSLSFSPPLSALATWWWCCSRWFTVAASPLQTQMTVWKGCSTNTASYPPVVSSVFSLYCHVPPPHFLSPHCHLSSLFFPSPIAFFFSPFIAKTACIFSFILKTFGNGPITEAICGIFFLRFLSAETTALKMVMNSVLGNDAVSQFK